VTYVPLARFLPIDRRVAILLRGPAGRMHAPAYHLRVAFRTR
jgi:hypothetical protein